MLTVLIVTLLVQLIIWSGQNVGQECTIGFPTSNLTPIAITNSHTSTHIIPEMKFACNGTLRSVIFSGEVKKNVSCSYPVFQTWRGVIGENNRTTYSVVHPNLTCGDNSPMLKSMHKLCCTLMGSDNNLMFDERDIFGVVLPATDEACISLYFVSENTSNVDIPTNYVFYTQLSDNGAIVLDDSNTTHQGLPLVYFEVEQGKTGFTTSTLPVTSNTETHDNIQAREPPIIGSFITVLLVVTIVLLVIVLIVIKRNKKEAKDSKRQTTTQQVFTNQNYDSADIIASQGVTEGREYASVVSYQDINTSNPESPVHTTETHNQASLQQRFPNQEGSLTSSYPHYEQQAYYVPTGEQRMLVTVQCDYTGEDNETRRNVPVFFEESDSFWEPSSNPDELYEQLHTKKYREILTSQIQISTHDQLGIGNFGTVHKGIWQSPMGAMDVAVKTLHSGAKEEEKVKYLQEAAINGQFRHPNVVQLMGVVTVEEPVMIVLELLSNGDLHNYLIKQRPNSMEKSSLHIVPSTLLKFCQQITSGMEYLSKKGFVHRDLAARNILVAEDKTCKISDFGMCRDLVDDDYYVSHGGEVPVKWTAPEAIYYKKYSTASDVWSFGCVMYEIWSLGHKPFEVYSNREAAKMVEKGYRLPPPPGCSKELYKVMIRCWNPKTDCRPSFGSLLETLCKPEYELFMWKENDDFESRVVGAPLELGQNLYPTLQTVYLDRYNCDSVSTLYGKDWHEFKC